MYMLWDQYYIESTLTQSYFSHNGCIFLRQTKIRRKDDLQSKKHVRNLIYLTKYPIFVQCLYM